uniref:NADH dehydrogenase-like complex L n=1 Tax=Hypseocharis bilobata TaxID=253189 RepID=A0A0F7GZS1_9ROSI
MSFSLSFQIPKALPSLLPSQQVQHKTLLPINSQLNQSHNAKQSDKTPTSISQKQSKNSFLQPMKSSLAIQIAAVLATVHEQPALAVTGVNNQEDLGWVLIQLGIVAFLYFLVAPPIIMNWMRTRWYKRNLLEMYLQFMFTFIFFPGILIWAPFLNFRKLPRDPNMKYPWSKPEDPSKIKSGYLKYPFAKPDDYIVD